MRIKLTVAVTMGALVALSAAAYAHVTVQPEEVPAGGFARLDVRVPNEMDDAATDKVEVQMPDGFLFVSYEPVEGWSTEVKSEKLDQPIEEHGEEISEQIDTVTWTADDPSAAIQPGQFRDFGLSAGMPADAAAGEQLEFPALQTYDNGDVVRWVGAPDSEEPAALVTLTPGEEEEEATGTEDDAEAAVEDEATATEETEEEDDGAPAWVSVLALIVGGLGLIVGGSALMRNRRTG